MFSDLGTHLKRCVLDEWTAPMLSKVFDPKKAAERKEWLLDAEVDVDRMDYESNTMNLTTFLKTEVKTYSLDSVDRAIPSMCDFLKGKWLMKPCPTFRHLTPPTESQRKILFAALDHFGKANNEFKARFHDRYSTPRNLRTTSSHTGCPTGPSGCGQDDVPAWRGQLGFQHRENEPKLYWPMQSSPAMRRGCLWFKNPEREGPREPPVHFH